MYPGESRRRVPVGAAMSDYLALWVGCLIGLAAIWGSTALVLRDKLTSSQGLGIVIGVQVGWVAFMFLLLR